MSRWAKILDEEANSLGEDKKLPFVDSAVTDTPLPEDSESKQSIVSRWHESLTKPNEIFGLGNYNACYKFSPIKSAFCIPPKMKHFPEVAACDMYLDYFNQIQNAVGRIAVFTYYQSSPSFWSGIFVSPTIFITRAHFIEKEGDIKPVRELTHRISWQFDATHSTSEFWYPAKLIEFSLYEDFAVFELVEGKAEKWISLDDIYTGEIKVGDFVVGMVYNGKLDLDSLKRYYDSVSEKEKPPIMLYPLAVDDYFHPGYKTISPGQIVVISSSTGNDEMGDLLIGISCSCSRDSSGGPIFLVRSGAPPVLIGSVLGSKGLHNYNRCTRYYPEVIDMVRNVLKEGEKKASEEKI